MSAINFKSLVHPCDEKYRYITIPKIQRDYAEGRETESVRKKRETLLTDLLDVVLDKNKSLSLDFVYGITSDDKFEPLDGQQRLTTLFLLHWLFGRNEDLRDTNDHSLFVYETRKTSEEFCHWLVKKEAKDILKDWEGKINEANSKNEENNKKRSESEDKIRARLIYPEIPVPTMSDYFKDMDEFKWDWHIDPNINSMLVVLEVAYNLLKERECSIDIYQNFSLNLNNITFEVLDSLKCDGDELFEKMNARGKALSSYDLLKSSLEEELTFLKKDDNILNNWKNDIDKKWIDYAWNSSNIPTNPTLDDVSKVEKKLERLLIRMIGKSLFKTDIQVYETIGIDFKDSIYKECDKVVENYFRYTRIARTTHKENITTLNFDGIYNDINYLLYEEDGKWKDIATFLKDNEFKIYPKDTKTLLDHFIADTLTHDIRVIFYAMMAWLNKYSASNIVKEEDYITNFKNWMRFVRNVYLSANRNERIDKPERVVTAINNIDNWLREYNKSNNNSSISILEFISQLSSDNDRIKEEAWKASLRTKSKEWDAVILEAEEHPYLWGQLIAPLSWCYDKEKNTYDLDSFKSYLYDLKEILSKDWDITLIKACLAIDDYRFNQNCNFGSLGVLTDDRDISWKRHLRNKDNNGVYGFLIKELIDNKKRSQSEEWSQFIQTLISEARLSGWRRLMCQLSNDEISSLFKLVGTSYRYVDFDNSYLYLYRSKTKRTDSIRYELLTAVFKVKKGELAEITHVTSPSGPSVKFNDGNSDVLISLSGDGNYKLTIGNNEETKSLDDILEQFKIFNK